MPEDATDALWQKAEAKIEAIGRRRHDELMPLLDEQDIAIAEVKSCRSLSDCGKREQDKFTQEMAEKLELLDQSFKEEAESIIKELEVIAQLELNPKQEEAESDELNEAQQQLA